MLKEFNITTRFIINTAQCLRLIYKQERINSLLITAHSLP